MTKAGLRRVGLLVLGICASFGVLQLLIAGTDGALAEASIIKPAFRFQSVSSHWLETIELPYTIAGTPLVLEEIASYDGPFLENDKQDEVQNVTAICLRNTDVRGVESAWITLESEDRQLAFELDTLPPGGRILVLEKNGAAYSDSSFLSCIGSAVLSTDSWSDTDIRFQELDMGTLEVTNTTNQTLRNIQIYYKNSLTDAQLLIGGRTYRIGIASLDAGKTLLLFPSHYAAGSSQIVRITHE